MKAMTKKQRMLIRDIEAQRATVMDIVEKVSKEGGKSQQVSALKLRLEMLYAAEVGVRLKTGQVEEVLRFMLQHCRPEDMRATMLMLVELDDRRAKEEKAVDLEKSRADLRRDLWGDVDEEGEEGEEEEEVGEAHAMSEYERQQVVEAQTQAGQGAFESRKTTPSQRWTAEAQAGEAQAGELNNDHEV